MKNKILGAMMAVAMASPVVGEAENTGHVNPFLAPYGTQFEIPPFDKIAIEDYVPAFTQGIEEARRDVAAIVDNKETPTFENTIVALDNAGATLERVSRVFYSLSEADSSPAMEEIAQTVSPMVSRYSDEVSMNEGLFERIKYLYEHRDGLDSAQKRAVEESYKQFVRNGALLAEADKARLSELNMQLSDLYLKFNKNLLNATNAFAVIVTDKSRLSGLPASAVATAAAEAEKRGLPNLKTTPEALATYDEFVDLFTEMKVLTKTELLARQDILQEEYHKLINIEAMTMIDMTKKDILPAVSAYMNELSTTAVNKKQIGVPTDIEVMLLNKLTALSVEAYSKLEALIVADSGRTEIEGNAAEAAYAAEKIVPAMEELRAVVDEMEVNTAGKYWPMPSYIDLLFGV